ncbi:MAG TPA: hypothetical protein VK108_01815 [Pseudogracilibacillus sp.]|nr:hypothetical protein [Pseudogracilibacillus sp.]
MKENKRTAFIVSLFVLVGIPAIFLMVSLYTGNWDFLIYSIPSALTAGLTGLILTKQKFKKDKTTG